MKKLRWGRIIVVLIVLLIVFFGGRFAYQTFFSASSNSATLPDGAALSLPPAPLTPQTMTSEQKQAAIDQARQDAIAAALSSGQTQAQANKFGELAAISATNAMNRPLNVETDGQ